MSTPEQYERWKDFASRMASVCFKRRRRPNSKEILASVEWFFARLSEDDLLCIVDWDNSERYPKESKHYRRTYQASCWHCHGAKKSDCPHGCEEGHIYRYEGPYCVGDMCSENSEYWNPYYWADITDEQHEKRQEQFCGPVTCCIRAGLDMAVSPSAGVLGYTAGDLRKMYTEGVPDWVTGGKDHRWSYWLEDEMNGTFAEMPDTAELVF